MAGYSPARTSLLDSQLQERNVHTGCVEAMQSAVIGPERGLLLKTLNGGRQRLSESRGKVLFCLLLKS